MAANGMHRHTFYDTLGDVRNIELAIKTTKEVGLYVCAGFAYALSPVHTDAFYAGVAREIVGHGLGRLHHQGTPVVCSRPTVYARSCRRWREAIGPDLPLEIHSHCRGGLAELCYLEAVPLGVDVLHTAISPMAGSDSLPPTEYFVEHLGNMGYQIKLNLDDLAEMADYFTALAERYEKPLGVHKRYDPALYDHQIPGGMISNLHSQLADIGMSDKFEEVLVEAVQVRQDLGYPVVVSPFAQYTVTQSVINVAQGERYKTIPDEIARYAMGFYGTPVGPILPGIVEKSAEKLGMKEPITQRAGELVEPWIPRLKKERGPFQVGRRPVARRLLPAFGSRKALRRPRRAGSQYGLPSFGADAAETAHDRDREATDPEVRQRQERGLHFRSRGTASGRGVESGGGRMSTAATDSQALAGPVRARLDSHRWGLRGTPPAWAVASFFDSSSYTSMAARFIP